MNNEYNNILIALDGSQASEKAFTRTVDIVKRNNAHLIIAHVIEFRSLAYADSFSGSLAQQAEEYAKELLDKFVNKAVEAGITNISRCIEYGSPKIKTPKDIVKKFNVDLIICGATGMNAVERFLIGSVSEGITRYAPCDVLVVR